MARWIQVSLKLAALYNIVWGAWVILFPNQLFLWLGATPPNYPQLWQCIGMIVGVYGVGYWIASFDYLKHWPIVLVGFLGKIFGPIGFIQALVEGSFPAGFGWTIITNDLIWWVPFFLALKQAFEFHSRPPVPALKLPNAKTALENLYQTLDLAKNQKYLIVFLRHKGCNFCREALSQLSSAFESKPQSSVIPIFIHMSDEDIGRQMISGFKFNRFHSLSDRDRQFYRGFQLPEAQWNQAFSFKVIYRALISFFRGHGVGRLEGNGWQLPGVFLVEDQQLRREHRYQDVSDHPSWAEWI